MSEHGTIKENMGWEDCSHDEVFQCFYKGEIKRDGQDALKYQMHEEDEQTLNTILIYYYKNL